jgi:glycosyltransferase involved in cell wall biosynthesis
MLALETTPLVSCIMPTAGRRRFVPQAVRYFQAQDYATKELVVLDDGADPIADVMPDDPQVRYIRSPGRHTLGWKRNECVNQSRGSVIVHWDDDDWHGPRRLSCQVESLFEGQADACGVSNMLFFDPATTRGWHYVYPSGNRPWVAGGTMCYTKAFWERNRFRDINVGEDTQFVWSAQPKKLLVLPDNTFYVAIIHPGNTSRKVTSDRRYRPYPVENICRLMGDDFSFYERMNRASGGRQTPARPGAAALTES